MLQGHGDDSYRYKNIVADFSSNVWYGGEPAGLKQAIFNSWESINHYPEVASESLVNKIADHHNLTPNQVLVSNGSTESIYLIAQAFRNKRTLVISPSFSEYHDACKMHGHDINFLDWDNLAENMLLDYDLVILGNPNNPTGLVFANLTELINYNPNVIFAVDEAFIEFTLAATSIIESIQQFKNLIVMRSLTKIYAIPGLRLGYVAASEQLIKKLNNFMLPWAVNAFAIVAGHFIFDNYEKFKLPLLQLLGDKEIFIKQLEALQFTVRPSNTHFFIVETNSESATRLKEFLTTEFNLLIRDASNFRGLSERCFRLATLQPEKNELLIEALKVWQSR